MYGDNSIYKKFNWRNIVKMKLKESLNAPELLDYYLTQAQHYIPSEILNYDIEVIYTGICL